MSIEGYIRLYQELLTMVDPDNEMSVEYAIIILRQIMVLASQSEKVDPLTFRYMEEGIENFKFIARHREEFAGKPGNFHGNQAKRARLKQMIYMHC